MTHVFTDNARNLDKIRDGLKEDDSSLHDFVELALQLLSAPASSASTEMIFQALRGSTLRYGIALVPRKQPSWYFVTGSSEDFVILINDISNGWIQVYMCERCESLLLNYYFTFSFVIFKYTNSDINRSKVKVYDSLRWYMTS